MAVIGSIKELYEGHIVTFNVSDLKTDGTGLPVKYDVVSLVDGKIVKAIAQKNVTNNNLLGIIVDINSNSGIVSILNEGTFITTHFNSFGPEKVLYLSPFESGVLTDAEPTTGVDTGNFITLTNGLFFKGSFYEEELIDDETFNLLKSQLSILDPIYTKLTELENSINSGNNSAITTEIDNIKNNLSNFLGKTQKAADSSLLNGLESTKFVRKEIGTFNVGGTSDKFYPVIFQGISRTSKVKIYRDSLHENGSNYGTFELNLNVSHSNGGNYVSEIKEMQYFVGLGTPFNDPVGDIDFKTDNNRLIVWLRGNATYHYDTDFHILINENSSGIDIVDGSVTFLTLTSQSSLVTSNKGVCFSSKSINASSFRENGVELSAKYLGISANAVSASKLQTARTIAGVSFDGSANIAIPFSGLSSKPNTLSGYGITDATPSSHIGTTGSSHGVVTQSVNGFMSSADKINLDKLPLLSQGLRNSFLCDGGELRWGMTANVFSWSKAFNIYPAQGTLILNGLPFKKITIAASNVTLSSAGQCAYITVPTSYSDEANLVGTCTMTVADATTVSGTDKVILYVRDADNCLQGWDGWVVYGTIVQAGGKRDAYVENLFTAANDFVLGSGSRTFVKKTLAETRAILGATANTASTLVLRDASGNFTAGTITATAFSGNATSASKVNSLLTRGTGLTGNNFDGSSATTWAVSYGTTSGTACQGNDSRLSDSRVASDVYAWAKASTKPSYTFAEIGSKPNTLSGYGITDAVFSTDRSNWNNASVIGNVVGQLAWKNYGNNHTIFDASAGTAPDGTAINNTNPGVVWSATYPTLMGWNGSSTYGVRVDSARNADYLSGLLLNTSGRANVANQIVRTDSNGYIQAGWINTTSGNNGTTAISKIYASSDDYLRYYTPANFISLLNLVKGDDSRLSDSRVASDVYAWAKASVKPSYDFSEIANKPNTLAGYGITDASFSNASFGGTTATFFSSGTTGTVTIYGTLVASGNITGISDKTLKENIHKIEGVLDKIKKISGYTYNFINDKNKKTYIGMMAQEWEKDFSELVETDSYGKKSLAYMNTTAVLLEAIKELDEKIYFINKKIDRM